MADYISNDDFVDKWLIAHNTGQSQTQLAETLGISRQAVSERARNMRTAGVNLPRLNGIPVEEMNRKINETIGV